jgi:hypothetical protein
MSSLARRRARALRGMAADLVAAGLIGQAEIDALAREIAGAPTDEETAAVINKYFTLASERMENELLHMAEIGQKN